MRVVTLLLLVGCNEFGIDAKPPDPVEPDDSDVAVPVDSDVPEPTCADVQLTPIRWTASTPFAGADDPRDGGGRAFWDPGHDGTGLSAITLPDIGQIPPGQDRAYVGTLDVVGTPPALTLDLQSDDGIAVWIDGVAVGTWGGAWQQEGCVNDQANCLQFVLVDPVDVTDLLGEGTHVLAMRVSNPVEGSYADLSVFCED
jgi:hypothetical protein